MAVRWFDGGGDLRSLSLSLCRNSIHVRILFIYYNLGLMHFPVTKIFRRVMRFMCLWLNLFFSLITPLGILWLENVSTLNYDQWKVLIFRKKKKRKRRACDMLNQGMWKSLLYIYALFLASSWAIILFVGPTIVN